MDFFKSQESMTAIGWILRIEQHYLDNGRQQADRAGACGSGAKELLVYQTKEGD